MKDDEGSNFLLLLSEKEIPKFKNSPPKKIQEQASPEVCNTTCRKAKNAGPVFKPGAPSFPHENPDLPVKKEECILEYSMFATCPEYWIGFRGKCYYFSEETRNWTFSQTFCVSMESTLVQFETLEELNFLKRYKGPSDHWVGLSRESSHGVWKWTDGTEHNSSLIIRGVGECAYLNDIGVSSARMYTDRKWICSKQNIFPQRCQMTSRYK
ncbi:C-type lectin domain family 2 member D-like [Orycteropus afer afer]|uniref:C-type lectin domain family 2 member D-like n=1 Tax=Orycteropus afer afer TaxID=1230840 RepID=A0A8B6ZIA3_ORYAF|nr:C-type lectin domain family 2 member D-like [Orycteropus afer afer]